MQMMYRRLYLIVTSSVIQISDLTISSDRKLFFLNCSVEIAISLFNCMVC